MLALLNTISVNSQGVISRETEIRIGDFFYSDGSTSHIRDSEKECVGIVFSLHPSKEEQRMGFSHGYIVALEDAAEGKKVNWGKNIDLPSPHTNIDYTEDFKNDCNGYIYNFKGKFDYTNHAFILAINYKAALPRNKTTGWYLPSVGQWYELLSNLGGLKLQNHFYFNSVLLKRKLLDKGLTLKEDSYLTSTERDNMMTWIVDFDSEQGGFYSPWNSKKTKHRVRAIAAF